MSGLPLVHAIAYRRELPSGTTRPCVFLCESAEGDTEEYVTKMRHDVRDSGLGFEYIAYHLARHFQLDCPSAALVRLTRELAVAQEYSPSLRDRILRNEGLNFGSVFLSGHTTWLPAMRILAGFRKQAAEIIAFDALIDNADRRKDKPNLLVGPVRTLVIDHELSFSFLRLVGGASPWFQRLQFLCDHPFYDGLRGQEFTLDDFHDRLLELDDDIIGDICSSVPAEFEFVHHDRIVDYLRAVRADADGFIRGVEEVLQ